MTPKHFFRFAAVLTAIVCAASTISAHAGQAQTSNLAADLSGDSLGDLTGDASGAAEPAQSQPQATPKTYKKKPAQLGVWHHFGESTSTPQAKTNEPDGWRAYQPPRAAPKAGPVYSTARLQSRTHDIRELELLMYELLNRDRSDPANTAETRGSANALRWNEELAAVARAHSRDMMMRGYFDHADLQGNSPGKRIDGQGIHWQAYGENIAYSHDTTEAEAAFMNEPRFQQNHRANILNPKYTDVGVGIVQGPNGMVYVTQDFITAPNSSREVASMGGGTSHSVTRQQSLQPLQSKTRDIRELELLMYELLNRDRSDPANTAETRGSANALRWNEELASVARAHSRDMMMQGYFDHVDMQGRSPGKRIDGQGIRWQVYGENIAFSHDTTEAEAAFMNEPRFEHNHRANILNPKYTDVGVGIVQGPNGMVYVTQDFITAPNSSRASAATPAR
jgi:uncharacterized protein YkwD